MHCDDMRFVRNNNSRVSRQQVNYQTGTYMILQTKIIKYCMFEVVEYWYFTSIVPAPSATLQPDIKNGAFWSFRTCKMSRFWENEGSNINYISQQDLTSLQSCFPQSCWIHRWKENVQKLKLHLLGPGNNAKIEAWITSCNIVNLQKQILYTQLNQLTWSPILRGITSPTTISYIEIFSLLPPRTTYTNMHTNLAT